MRMIQAVKAPMDKPDSTSRWLSWVVPLGIVSAGIACIGFYLWSAMSAFEPYDCLQPSPDTLINFPHGIGGIDSVEGMTIFVPPSAQNIGSQCVNFQGMVLHLWFDMNPDDLELMLKESGIDQATLIPSEAVVYAPKFGPTPRGKDHAGYFMLQKSCENEEPCGMSLWIEGTDPNLYRVYVSFTYGD